MECVCGYEEIMKEDWEGDPGRTLKIESAKKFGSRKKADKALNNALYYRKFPLAKIKAV
jgi:hypothetical protein